MKKEQKQKQENQSKGACEKRTLFYLLKIDIFLFRFYTINRKMEK